MFMITTTNGVRVFAGFREGGLGADQADSLLKIKNEAAVKLGIKARYIKAPYTPPTK